MKELAGIEEQNCSAQKLPESYCIYMISYKKNTKIKSPMKNKKMK
jgi:hypothetical protein